jgi:hypothetical protein
MVVNLDGGSVGRSVNTLVNASLPGLISLGDQNFLKKFSENSYTDSQKILMGVGFYLETRYTTLQQVQDAIQDEVAWFAVVGEFFPPESSQKFLTTLEVFRFPAIISSEISHKPWNFP